MRTADDVQAELDARRAARKRTRQMKTPAPATIENPRPPSPVERPPPVLQAFMRWRDANERHHWTEARAALAELDRWKENPHGKPERPEADD